MSFNEDSRVKIPAILHLIRLGYQYLSLKDSQWELSANIFPNIFKESISRINREPAISPEEVDSLLEDILLELDNQDLGQAFYNRLTCQSGFKIIDFEDFANNSFHVVTELTCKNELDEFRPDITLLINGMPLVFIEVKKPNNREGILAERNRINVRLQNSRFRRFINITQLMMFSNNMEYDDSDSLQVEGAFYASPSYHEPTFNYFREEESFDLNTLLKDEDDTVENSVLADNNLLVIKHSPEFLTNKNPTTPTNRLLTSLFSPDRLSFLLKYAFAYVKQESGLQKHVMRYPQIFATKQIEKMLERGVKQGIIWHTQGSGKTALAYYNVKYLTDYFQKKGVIPKFYFIVDRLDLLTQASNEFSKRGLVVHSVNSREQFASDIKSTAAKHGDSGKPEITVVNIQKFKDEQNVIRTEDYDVNVQRVYFLDEVHRSYNPKGSFLANLKESDTHAIKIGLTGTPLLGEDYNSRLLFGDYIHKYYYNASIADGYTLRLIREEIESKYKIQLAGILDAIQLKQGDIDKKEIYCHKQFVDPMLEYIINDFDTSRIMFDDPTIGGLVVCDSAQQARMMYELFTQKYNDKRTAALILHDEGSKVDRKDWVNDFKNGKIDLLFVYNMLLTGFDAPRLKKVFLGRVIKRHNLLQTLTRVNRTYGSHKYGYVVDFADIKAEFDATNKAYFAELNSELGDEIEHYSHLFKSKEEIEADIERIKDILFQFDTMNAEVFSQQISQINDRKQMQAIVRVLGLARSLYNMIRLMGHYDLLEKLDFQKLSVLYREADNHLALLNLKESLEKGNETSNLLNLALEDIFFQFVKIGEEELKLADELKNTLRQTREALASNFDQSDPKFISLREELERLFKKKNLAEVTQDEMNRNIGLLRKIYEQAKELNRSNNLLRDKYQKDRKYARVHKRLLETGNLSSKERLIHSALIAIKLATDERVLLNNHLIDNENYLSNLICSSVIKEFQAVNLLKLDPEITRYINSLIVDEYIKEFNGNGNAA